MLENSVYGFIDRYQLSLEACFHCHRLIWKKQVLFTMLKPDLWSPGDAPNCSIRKRGGVSEDQCMQWMPLIRKPCSRVVPPADHGASVWQQSSVSSDLFTIGFNSKFHPTLLMSISQFILKVQSKYFFKAFQLGNVPYHKPFLSPFYYDFRTD